MGAKRALKPRWILQVENLDGTVRATLNRRFWVPKKNGARTLGFPGINNTPERWVVFAGWNNI